MRTKSYKPKKVSIVTLGSSKNMIDSEVLQTQLETEDIETVYENSKRADTIIINTCGFIDNAKQESIDTLLAYAEEKKAGNIESLIVTGYLSERYKLDLSPEIPEVDKWYGTFELTQLLQNVGVDYKKELLGERKSSVSKHYEHMKNSEGCFRLGDFVNTKIIKAEAFDLIAKPI